ncbi:hypothetical protein RB595_009313 [Gaeumannomyces hyphopodioides]
MNIPTGLEPDEVSNSQHQSPDTPSQQTTEQQKKQTPNNHVIMFNERLVFGFRQLGGPHTMTGLWEPTTASQKDVQPVIDKVKKQLARPGGLSRPEEVQTLGIDGWVMLGSQMGLLYTFSDQYEPVSLAHEMAATPRPSRKDRVDLAGKIANTVRSLHVHHQINHPALRCGSFVYLRHKVTGKYNGPYLLDWSQCPTGPNLYQHPGYDDGTGKTRPAALWVDQAYALIMVLSEIVAWRPMNEPPPGVDAKAMRDARAKREMELRKGNWNAFPWALERLVGRTSEYHEKASHTNVKWFYDKLCDAISSQPLEDGMA